MRLKDRIAVVTGAASGIGRAVSIALAHAGARVGLVDRNADALGVLASELRAGGFECCDTAADVRDRESVHGAIAIVRRRFGAIQLLVANAGITGVTLVDDLDVLLMENILRVNLLGAAYCIEAVLPQMMAQGSGHIVAISSLAGVRGMPFSAAYCASKAGLAVYLESLRPALRKRGICVTTIFPGFVRTPLMEAAAAQPPMRMLSPESAARHIVFAIVKRKRVYAFPWSTRLLVGLLRYLPCGLYDWMMGQAAARIPNLEY